MFFAPLVALGLATASLATPFKRFNGLSVKLSSAGNVTSISDMKIDATVTNTGTEDVKILKYGTILDANTPTKSFNVQKDGQDVAFTGVKLSVVSLDQVTDDAFVSIPAGQSVTVSHSLEEVYDYAAAGEGAYSFTAVPNIQVAGSDDSVNSLGDLAKVEVQSDSVSVNVSGDLKKREKRATVSCSNSSQASFISASYTEGKALASGAANYIASNGANSLYTAYYGTTSTTTIRNRFLAVANENSGSRTLSCSDPYGVCDGNVIAYTVTSTTNIYFCSIFYNEVASSRLCSGTTVASRNVRGGTTLHELTHATSGTTDVTYGCSADQSLSTSQKASNADNYNCFSTQVYANTQC